MNSLAALAECFWSFYCSMRNPGESGECFAGNRFVAFCYRCRRRRRRGDTDVSFLILSFGTLVIYATKKGIRSHAVICSAVNYKPSNSKK